MMTFWRSKYVALIVQITVLRLTNKLNCSALFYLEWKKPTGVLISP